MSENAADNDPLVEVFTNVESADERIKSVLSSIGSSLIKTFEEYTVKRDKLVKSAQIADAESRPITIVDGTVLNRKN